MGPGSRKIVPPWRFFGPPEVVQGKIVPPWRVWIQTWFLRLSGVQFKKDCATMKPLESKNGVRFKKEVPPWRLLESKMVFWSPGTGSRKVGYHEDYRDPNGFFWLLEHVSWKLCHHEGYLILKWFFWHLGAGVKVRLCHLKVRPIVTDCGTMKVVQDGRIFFYLFLIFFHFVTNAA